MTVPTSCKNFCATLRRTGFTEDLSKPSGTFCEDTMNNTAVKMKWSERTCQRYLGPEGLLVKFGYIAINKDDEYQIITYSLTGEDLNE